MAVMLGRFLHFYPGYTAESALQMPWRRFLALLGAIKVLRADEDLRALEARAVAAHPGERGESFDALANRLRKEAGGQGAEVGGQRSEVSVWAPGVNPAVAYEAEPGSIEAERARQKAAWEGMKRRREGERGRGGEGETQERGEGGK